MYRAPINAKLKLTLKMPKTNRIAIVLQQNEWRSYRGPRATFVCEREIKGDDAEQMLELEAKDFTSSNAALTSWEQIDQLGICAHFTERGKPAEAPPLWQGAALVLARLEWI